MKRDLNRRSSTGPPFISWLSIRWTCCLISVMVSSPLDWSRSLETQDCKELKALFIVGIFWSLENESSRKIQHGEETLSDILSGIHHRLFTIIHSFSCCSFQAMGEIPRNDGRASPRVTARPKQRLKRREGMEMQRSYIPSFSLMLCISMKGRPTGSTGLQMCALCHKFLDRSSRERTVVSCLTAIFFHILWAKGKERKETAVKTRTYPLKLLYKKWR